MEATKIGYHYSSSYIKSFIFPRFTKKRELEIYFILIRRTLERSLVEIIMQKINLI